MPADPTAVLRADHRTIERLLREIADGDPSALPPIVQELATVLQAHLELEERALYPVAEEQAGESEHRQVRSALIQVQALSPDGPGFGAAVAELAAAFGHHVQDLESEVFPRLVEELDATGLEQLDEAIADGRRQLGLPARDDG